MYGKIYGIYEYPYSEEEMSRIFSPAEVFVLINDRSDLKVGDLYDLNTGKFSVINYSFEELKANKWSEIKALRDKIEQSGCPFKDTFIDSDLISVSRINVACIAAQAALTSGQEFSIDWTMKDNSTRKLTAVEVIEMSSALASWSNTCHEKGRLLREQIEAATTVEDLEKIKW